MRPLGPATMGAMRYLLGYDGTCGTCTRIARGVRTLGGGALEIAPLQSRRMRRVRREVFGPDAPWAATLVAVGRPVALRTDAVARRSVRAQTGWRMVPAFWRAVGPWTGLRIVALAGRELSRRPVRGPAAPMIEALIGVRALLQQPAASGRGHSPHR